MLIVSVSGVRGLVGNGLTAEVAARFAAAFGAYCRQFGASFRTGGPRIVLTRDGRYSGEMLRHAVLAGLIEVGCEVVDYKIAPTPTCGRGVRDVNAAGGIQITASHNPVPWNGLKMFGPDGAVLSADEGERVRRLYESNDFERARWDQLGWILPHPAGVPAYHVAAVLRTVDQAAVAEQKFRVLLDANGGAGGPLGLKLLRDLGCEVAPLGCEPTGKFEHEPEPIPAHLGGVAPQVPQAKAAVGFVLDPDADRLALIDERGNCLSEEATLALAVEYRLRKQKGPVAINMSTSRMVEDIAQRHGCLCHRSAVGEANVVSRMRAVDAVIGGEGNGGVIDPRVGWVRDPFVGMAAVLALLAEERRPLSAVVADLPRYCMLKRKVAVSRERLPAVLDGLEKRWPQARADRQDGLRIDGEDWWLHVRGSNTEPVVRVIAEAPTQERSEALCNVAEELISRA